MMWSICIDGGWTYVDESPTEAQAHEKARRMGLAGYSVHRVGARAEVERDDSGFAFEVSDG